jgi:hypothetical protein
MGRRIPVRSSRQATAESGKGAFAVHHKILSSAFGLVLSATVISSVWAGTAQSSTPATAGEAASVTRLQVLKNTPEALNVTLFDKEGVAFVLVLSQPQKFIVGVDEEASTLTSATDDKGTDLAEGQSDKWISGFFSKIGKNNHKVAIPVTLHGLPASDATTLLVKGEIVLKCGSDEKTELVKPFELAKGTTVKCGAYTLSVNAGEKSPFGGMLGGKADKKQQSLSITVDESGHWLKKFEFVDEQGNVIKSKRNGSSGGNDSVTYNVELSSDVKAAGLRVTYFQKMEDVKQSVDLKIGVGLQ